MPLLSRMYWVCNTVMHVSKSRQPIKSQAVDWEGSITHTWPITQIMQNLRICIQKWANMCPWTETDAMGKNLDEQS